MSDTSGSLHFILRLSATW